MAHIPALHLRIIGRRAIDRPVDIAVAQFYLASRPKLWDNGRYELGVVCQRFIVVNCQRHAIPRRDTPVKGLPGINREQPRPQTVDLLIDGPLCAGSKRNHRNDSCYANNDAEHSQRGAQRVREYGFERNSDGFEDRQGLAYFLLLVRPGMPMRPLMRF